ncbi:tRNA1(Val) (adenine(37)-N6)-methyltransferase [Salisediminibacterium halotolerans]|uniref:tRNA1(Val) A37 N6-methylase TrmN6 n=1 Tax=Salisediminibacterium halotolerans TaxID=517425 RepID=A0A1H9VS31_9BACI|nr:methyltransferase [Salisediminibacterium haloalkalitolerans]SES24073.1 tRNA1(Val) A37 N6-methylase TrmN6 [Salisediminibacterium haloalkalitolerans]
MCTGEEKHRMPGGRQVIVQQSGSFLFSVDAVLLGKFARITKKTERIADLCAGTGAVSLALSERTRAVIDAVELKAELCQMMKASAAENDLLWQWRIIEADVKELPAELLRNEYDVVVSNPPYFPLSAGTPPAGKDLITDAKHETRCTFADVAKAAAAMLKSKGRFVFVHRPERLAGLMADLANYGFAVKRMRFVHAKADRSAGSVLIEAVRAGNPGLEVDPPLTVYTADNEYTKEFRDIYER